MKGGGIARGVTALSPRVSHEEELERVDELVDELKSKHGTLYANIQYRVWAETIDSGHHSGVDSPPRRKFKFQGRKGTKSSPSTPPRSQQPRSEIVLTPGKTAQLCSTYIQQIKDLHSLVDIGGLSKLMKILSSRGIYCYSRWTN